MAKRLLQALRQARPATARQFLALANQHRRWQLHDLARRLEEQPEAPELRDESVPASTVHRRLSRGLQLLAATLGDLYPGGEDAAAP